MITHLSIISHSSSPPAEPATSDKTSRKGLERPRQRETPGLSTERKTGKSVVIADPFTYVPGFWQHEASPGKPAGRLEASPQNFQWKPAGRMETLPQNFQWKPAGRMEALPKNFQWKPAGRLEALPQNFQWKPAGRMEALPQNVQWKRNEEIPDRVEDLEEGWSRN